MSNSPLSSAVIAVIVVIVSGYVVSYSVDIDTVADIIFAGMLNAAYATQGALNLTPAGNINHTSGSQDLESSTEIVIFESGNHTYAAVMAHDDDGDDVIQILNVTDPSYITAAGSITNNATLVLDSSQGIAIFESGNHTYAAVSAGVDDGVQILNITDPYLITAAGSITNSTGVGFFNPTGITTFESGDSTYAAVVSLDGFVQVLDVTDPPDITAVGNITDTSDMSPCTAPPNVVPYLCGATGITTFKSGDHTYAAVTGNIEAGVQILNVTDPSNITAAGNITTSALTGGQAITTFESGNHTYAAVTSVGGSGYFSILNVTDPYDITAAGSVEDGVGNDGLKFKDPFGVAIFKSGSKIYAAVTGDTDHGVQMLDVTDPSVITAVGSITNSTSVKLAGAHGIAIFKSGTDTYAAVTANNDHGVQIIKIAKVDPVPPDIMLTGNATVTIEAYDEYTDEGADCSDAVDKEDITLTPVSTVDITLVGNYTVTYSCMDTSGNNAVPVSRTVIVEDTTPPVIILNDDATVYVIRGKPYEEQGAVCSDLVDGVIDVTVDNNSVDTDAPEVYTVTYDCTDAAGNGAERETRTVIVRVPGSAMPADVTSATKNGTYGPGEIVDVRITFTEKVSLETFGIRDGNDMNASLFKELDGATSVTTIMIDSRHYALVASVRDDGVQIIDITTPSSPTAVANVTDSTTENLTDYTELDGATSVTTTTIDSRHYALVASRIDNGVQIIDITTPSSPTAVANVTDSTTENLTDYTVLKGATSITTTTIDSRHYALVASFFDDGVQIIDITTPSSPSAVAGITDDGSDGNNGTFDVLKGAFSVTTATIPVNGTVGHYALVTSEGDNGVQIINITAPSSPTAVASVTRCTGSCMAPTDYPVLDDPVSVTTTKIRVNGTDGHYALVASEGDNGVQIIDITDPSSPTAVAGITDGGTFDMLKDPRSVTTAKIQVNGTDRHYALVAASTDNGVQIIDITDPSIPTAVASVTDNSTANPTNYSELQGASSVTTTYIGSRHYALVSSVGDNGVQIIDITEPARPLNSLLPYVALDLVGDRRAAYAVMQDDDGKSLAFEYLVGPVDWTTDLAYLGTDALNLGRNNLTDAFDSTDLSGVMLPVPGNPHSLSYNKDIMLSDTAAFVTTWRTDEDSDTITLPINGSGMTVVWGDGHVDRGISAPVNHTYTTAGDYTVQVTGGLTVFNLNGHGDAPKMISIDQWGNASWTTMKNAFRGADSMSYHSTDAPDLSGVTDMSSMFDGAASFNGDISGWNVSSATDMTGMFSGAGIFEQNLGEWYIVPNSTFIAGPDIPGVVGSISAQNGFLENHNATYDIGTGGYSALFEINGTELSMTSAGARSSYGVNVTASGSAVFEEGNNWRMLDVTVTSRYDPPVPPAFVSSELNVVTWMLGITFSEAIDVTPKEMVVPAKIHIRESGNYTGGGITLTAEELDTTVDGATISFNLTASHRETVAGLFKPELTVEAGAILDTSGNPIDGSFDVSTAAFTDVTFPVSSQEPSPTGMAFSNDGKKMFVIGDDGGGEINEYTLSTPFDLSTASSANVNFSVSLQDINPTGMAFSNDGKKMFVIGNGTGGSINEYTLSDPFDLSTASFANVNFSVSPQDMNPTGMAFSNDSTTMFVVGLNKSDVNEYTLSAPFGISTATFVDAFSVSSQESSPTGMAFSNDGAKMFVIGDDGVDVNEYALFTPFDISIAAFVDAFSVSSQETSPTGMAFSSDGTKMFVIGDGARGESNINEYALTSIYPIDVVSEVGGNPASLASVTSSTADGAYGPDTVIDVQISFPEPVSLQTFPIQDSHPRVDLDAGRGAQIMHADGRHYAVVADRGDDSVRIIDISDPDRPDIVSEVYDTYDGFALDGSAELDIALIGERQYVMVGTDEYEASGLQLIDVTDPLNPTAGGAVQGLKGDEFNLIDVVTGVSAMQIGDHHYALVASVNVNGTTGSIVIVNITDPDNLSHVWSERADLGILAGYHHAFDIFPVHIDGHPYAAASFNDISGSRSSILILNMTDPGSPTLASSSLHWSREAAVTEVDGHHYVLTGQHPRQTASPYSTSPTPPPLIPWPT